MTTKFTKIKNAYINYMTHRAQAEVHRVLLTQSDRALEDMGISRALLEGGVSNWPWTVPAEDNFSLHAGKNAEKNAANSNAVAQTEVARKSNRQQIAAAIRELNAYSDHQLRDLGIHRGMIKDAVMNGRYGIDNIKPVKASTELAHASEEVSMAAPKVANVGFTQQSANDTDLPQPPMTPPNSGGGSRQAA